MKDITAPHKFLVYVLGQAIRHPRKPIKYLYCPECDLRFPGNSDGCPNCGKKVKANPGPENEAEQRPEVKTQSAVPWWGALLCIILGIASWIAGACVPIPGLDEAARALVYIPLGSIFGISLQRG